MVKLIFSKSGKFRPKKQIWRKIRQIICNFHHSKPVNYKVINLGSLEFTGVFLEGSRPTSITILDLSSNRLLNVGEERMDRCYYQTLCSSKFKANNCGWALSRPCKRKPYSFLYLYSCVAGEVGRGLREKHIIRASPLVCKLVKKKIGKKKPNTPQWEQPNAAFCTGTGSGATANAKPTASGISATKCGGISAKPRWCPSENPQWNMSEKSSENEMHCREVSFSTNFQLNPARLPARLVSPGLEVQSWWDWSPPVSQALLGRLQVLQRTTHRSPQTLY